MLQWVVREILERKREKEIKLCIQIIINFYLTKCCRCSNLRSCGGRDSVYDNIKDAHKWSMHARDNMHMHVTHVHVHVHTLHIEIY